MKESIWKIGGFIPYVIVVFLNAFTDLGHKIIIQNTVFKIYDGEVQIILTAIVNALILLPFILLFSPSGFISDRYPKSLVMRLAAGVAVLITLVITASYYMGMFKLAFAMTFLLAVQSAIYSPAKYGYIKELVGNNYITMGNGIVQAVTTVSILGGILAYSILFEHYLEGVGYRNSADILKHIAPVGWALVIGSLVEFLLAYRLPNTHIECDKSFEVSKYLRLEYLGKNLKLLRKKEVIFVSIIGLSLFWGISQVVLSSFPEYAKNSLGIGNTVIVQGMMAIAGIGIVLGSIVAGKVSKNHIETGTIPLGALGITLSLFLLPILQHPWAHMLNFLLFGMASGLFIVPLNAMIQYRSEAHELGMILAGNNFMQNVVMVSFLGMTVLFALIGVGSIGLFYLMLAVAAVGTVLLIRKIPQSLVQFVILSIVSVRFKLKILDFDRFPQTGAVLMLGNHISWVDWALVQMAVPRRVHFVMDRSIYEKWYLKGFLDFFGAIPISARGMKQAIVDVERLLEAGEVVCIFPEGTISRNGHLGSFKRGFERMAGEADAVITPFYLRGLWGDPLSRSSKRLKELRRSRTNDVIIAFGEPMPAGSKAEDVKQSVFELSYRAWDAYSETLPSIGEAWIESARRSISRGSGSAYCMVEWGGKKISWLKMLSETIMISKRMREGANRRAGILLPAGSAGAISNMAALMAGREVVNLNYKLPKELFASTLEAAEIEVIYTDPGFLRTLKSKGFDAAETFGAAEIVDLPGMLGSIRRFERLSALLQARLLPAFLLKKFYLANRNSDSAAAVVFADGVKCAGNGTVLTHRNIMANIIQIFDMLNVQEDDILLGTMPLYSPTGLMTGLFLPMTQGIPAACYPDPANARGVGRAVARYEASILFSTPEFFDLYTRSSQIHPLMFSSLRIAISADRKSLSESIKKSFCDKFRRDIYGGYGVSELSVLASVNIPDILAANDFSVQIGNKEGSVGMPLPGTAFRIVDPESGEELPVGREGVVMIGGAQVMKGYLDSDSDRGRIVKRAGMRWFVSSERGALDEDGFLLISG